MSGPVLDALGVGAGPFNLGFAALAGPVADLDVTVLDGAAEMRWHPGMMLEGTHLQVPFMADLVTMADPTHPLSFLNYLKDAGRLYPFYIREDFYALRAEYNRYLGWAAARLPAVRFGHEVLGMRYDGGTYVAECATPDGLRTVRARNLVLGTGTTPHLPDEVSPAARASPNVIHSADYRDRRADLLAAGRIAVVGSGQSAAEVVADLLDRLAPGQRLDWISRSPRFFPLEYTKLTLEMTSPDYIDHFHALPQAAKDGLSAAQKGLYKGINADLINHLHERLYQLSVEGPVPVRIHSSTGLEALEPHRGVLRLALRNTDDGGLRLHDVDAVVLATGYRYREPGFLEGIAERINRLPDGRFDVDRGYSIGRHADIFVQNAELHTHGFTAPDLGMGAYRNSVIINRLLGREHYAVERRIAFQEFGTPATPPGADAPAGPDPLHRGDARPDPRRPQEVSP